MAEERSASGTGRFRLNLKGWLAVALLVVLVVFVAQNSQTVPIDFLFAEVETPLVFGLLAAGLLGALIAWLVPLVQRGRRTER